MFLFRWQENVAVLWWGWSLHPEVLVLSVLLYPRNCYRWLELMIATPVPGDVLLRLATLVWRNICILLFRHLYMNWCKRKRLFGWPLVFCSKSNIRCHCQHLFLLDPWPVEGDCLHQVSIPGVHWLPGQEPHPPGRTEAGAEGVLSIEIKAYKHCYHCLWIFWINSLTDIF